MNVSAPFLRAGPQGGGSASVREEGTSDGGARPSYPNTTNRILGHHYLFSWVLTPLQPDEFGSLVGAGFGLTRESFTNLPKVPDLFMPLRETGTPPTEDERTDLGHRVAEGAEDPKIGRASTLPRAARATPGSPPPRTPATASRGGIGPKSAWELRSPERQPPGHPLPPLARGGSKSRRHPHPRGARTRLLPGAISAESALRLCTNVHRSAPI